MTSNQGMTRDAGRYLIILWDGQKEVSLNDHQEHVAPDHGSMMTREEADAIATTVPGARVVHEDEYWCDWQDMDCDD